MKKILFYVVLLTCISSYSQDNQFKIIKVKGIINNKSTNLLLKQGDQVAQQIPIQFLSHASEAFAIVKGKGIYTISKQYADIFSKENSFAIQDVAAIMSDNVQLNLRNTTNEFCFNSKDFNNKDLFIIGDSAILIFATKDYPLNDKNYISFEYSVNGQDLISNPIKQEHSVIIEKDLFSNTTSDTIKNVNIMYYNTMRNSINKEASVNIIFINKVTLFNELSIIYKELKSTNNASGYLTKNLHNYFFSVYGLTNMNDLNNLICKIVQ